MQYVTSEGTIEEYILEWFCVHQYTCYCLQDLLMLQQGSVHENCWCLNNPQVWNAASHMIENACSSQQMYLTCLPNISGLYMSWAFISCRDSVMFYFIYSSSNYWIYLLCTHRPQIHNAHLLFSRPALLARSIFTAYPKMPLRGGKLPFRMIAISDVL